MSKEVVFNSSDAKKLFDFVHQSTSIIDDLITSKKKGIIWIDAIIDQPPNYESVLVFDGKEISMAYWSGTQWETCWHLEEEAIYGITHWAFLPEPPT